MNRRFKSLKEIGKTERKEKFTVMIPEKDMEFLRKAAAQERIPVAGLVNEAIRSYVEYLKDNESSDQT